MAETWLLSVLVACCFAGGVVVVALAFYEMNGGEAMGKWTLRVGLFALWPVLVPMMLALIAGLMLLTWPLLLTKYVEWDL